MAHNAMQANATNQGNKWGLMLMAGGTGGHVFPALAVAEHLRASGVPLTWLGTGRGLEATLVPRAGYPFTAVSARGLRRTGLLKQLAAPLWLVFALIECLWLLRRQKPGAVLGMGGYASGPGGLAAWLMRIPLLIHEQNAVPGVTNRLLAAFATRVMESFPDSFPARRSALCTGNPVRAEVAALVSSPLVSSLARGPGRGGALRLLVVGGSQGAAALNRVVPEAIAQVPGRAIDVWHQVGPLDGGETGKRYAALGIEARVEPFIEDVATAYAWAGLVLCRAGASTVFELCAAGAPAILVPYPFAADDHQSANARFLAERGAAVLLPQRDLDETALAALVGALRDDPARLAEMAAQARRLACPEATARVAAQCLEVLHARV
jgi:UDP-N-acetylglucosamine--N-acetylmuramyl-(pentapeptide) pyrophosphoryl-undecaprenol N-acetylglucosamine transferase